jgi:hypothetical protein
MHYKKVGTGILPRDWGGAVSKPVSCFSSNGFTSSTGAGEGRGRVVLVASAATGGFKPKFANDLRSAVKST